LKLPSALLNNGDLEWEDPESSPEEMDRGMADDHPQPLRDARGRRINVIVDKEVLTSWVHPEDVRDLYAVLLVPAPSEVLRSSMPEAEYQLC
jgi:hypothetical protein